MDFIEELVDCNCWTVGRLKEALKDVADDVLLTVPDDKNWGSWPVVSVTIYNRVLCIEGGYPPFCNSNAREQHVETMKAFHEHKINL